MAEEEEVKSNKGGKGLIIAIAGIVVLLVIVIAIVVVLLLGGGEEKSQEGVQEAPQEMQKSRKSQAMKSDLAKPGPIFAIPQPFIANLMGDNGRRYIKTSISLELSVPEMQKEITAKLPIIQDTINKILSSKTFLEISSPKGKLKLQEEIAQEINAYMSDGYIKSVFFTEFVIQ
ncbi:hypothetical protein BBW65_02875 [Helicobacter enhydrae]|uniref:Flagellar protein FliL n=1 Tax=Helicobacter enhydrae TaxID=222136 RepID=A0A1B1U4Y0_9HELI|nr:flagellar basal body-associated FliL family protein [Helicobacter enhydrae]ANV97810.1 hypothetical protein BBW65_02875 [Helicobacter enhydrae]